MKKVFVLLLILSIILVGCSKATTQVSNEMTKENQASQVNKDEDSQVTQEKDTVGDYTQAFSDYVKKINYKVAVNSGACQKILLPNSFDEKFNNYSIGAFLKEKNEKSKKNGLDFKDYMGKEVILYTCASANESQEGDLVLLISKGTVIGAWKSDKIKDYSKEKDDFHVILENTKHI